MSATTISQGHKPKLLPLFRLPLEIRDDILSYLLVTDSPIDFTDGIYYEAPSVNSVLEGTLRKFPVIDLIPSGYRFFYRYNTFHISCSQIPAFLDYRPTGPTVAAASEHSPPRNTIATPRHHITKLIVSIESDEAGPALHALLSCPSLMTLEIQTDSWDFDDVCEFYRLFRPIQDIGIELGEKLGAERVRVKGSVKRTLFIWSMAD
ncbi:MAG: hypothetical protein Q9199_000787 [Rusavskia elegans]